jgi:hypothetical protein
MAEKIVLASFEFDTEQIDRAKDANARLKKEIIEIRKEQSETNKAIKESGQVTDAQAASLSKSEAKLKDLNKEYQNNIKVVNANASSTDALNKALNEEVKTEQQALNNLQKLTQARKGIDATTKEGAAQIAILNKKIDENNKFITENSDKFTQQKRNVGNYTDSIKEAFAGQNLFNGSLKGFTSVIGVFQPLINKVSGDLSKVATDFRLATTATKGMTVAQKASAVSTALLSGAMKIFRLALISTGIGAIVVAFGSLITFLSTTQRGMDALTSVTRPLQAVFSSMLGVIQNLGGALFDTFTNPKKALTDLSDFVQQNLINRFTAFGKILEGIIDLDFDKVADGVLQAGTGVEDVVGKVKNASAETSKFLQKAVDEGKELDKLQKDIEQSEADIILTRAKTLEQMKAQELIAKDTSKSATERNNAAQQALWQSGDLISQEKDILDLKIRQELIQQRQNDSGRKDLTKLNQLKAEQIALDERSSADKLKFIGVNKAVQKEQIAAAKEQAAAIKARKDLAISAAKEELDFFQFAFDKKNATVDESLAFEQSVSEQRLAILDKEFSAGKISKTVYELEKLKIAEQLLTANAQLVVDQAAREIAIYDAANKSRIDSNKFLTDEILKEEDIRISALLEKQKEFARLKLEQGVISEQQYNDEVAILDADSQAKKDEVAALRAEQDIEAQAINLENLIAYRRLVGDSEYELSLEQLERDRVAEIEAAEKNHADVALINKKYEKQKSALSTAENNTRALQAVDTIESVFNAMQSIGIESKELSTGLALVNTYLAISKTLADPNLTFPANALAAVSIGAQGFAQVAKINGVKFADGGGVDGFQTGPSHRQGGMLFGVRNRPNYVGEFEGNEFIVNKNSAIKHRSLLERINSDKFANGGGIVGSIGQSITSSVSQSAMTPEQVLTAIESRIARLEVVNLASETYKVATAEIKVRNEAIR